MKMGAGRDPAMDDPEQKPPEQEQDALVMTLKLEDAPRVEEVPGLEEAPRLDKRSGKHQDQAQQAMQALRVVTQPPPVMTVTQWEGAERSQNAQLVLRKKKIDGFMRLGEVTYKAFPSLHRSSDVPLHPFPHSDVPDSKLQAYRALQCLTERESAKQSPFTHQDRDAAQRKRHTSGTIAAKAASGVSANPPHGMPSGRFMTRYLIRESRCVTSNQPGYPSGRAKLAAHRPPELPRIGGSKRFEYTGRTRVFG
ncbi:hypothetical protein J6590_030118 [Homalodisca vitripennis]|nr:hypothetical protein J6590_030118 [Homalodisca vitripennis]